MSKSNLMFGKLNLELQGFFYLLYYKVYFFATKLKSDILQVFMENVLVI